MSASRWIKCIHVLVIVLVIGVVYAGSSRAPFIFDDTHAIVENSHTRRLWPLHRSMAAPAQSPISGRPVVALSLAVNYAIGGLNPLGYHVFNLIVHALCACLLLAILRRSFERSEHGSSSAWLAAALALIWSIHPLQTEAVVYITQRTELIMALFFLLTLYCCDRGWSSPHKLGWFTAATGACALGMASKEVMVSAPLVVLLYDRAFVSGTFRTALKSHRFLHVGLFSTWLILGLLMINHPRSRSVGFGHDITSWQYLITQFGVIAWYLRSSVWPASLSIHHDWPIAENLAHVRLSALLLLTLLAGTAWSLWRRPRIGFLGASFFLILAPTSSFVPIITEIVAERRMYLPLVVVLVLIAVAVRRALQLISWNDWRVGTFATVVVAGVLAGTSIDRLNAYRSEQSIWQAVLGVYEDSAWALTGLGRVEAKRDRPEEAMAFYRRALDRDPTFVRARVNLAVAMLRLDQVDQAETQLRQALEERTDFVPIYTNLGIALVRQGKPKEAIAVFQHALSLNPEAVKVHNNLGVAWQKLGELGPAASAFQSAVDIDPDFAPARENLLALHNRLGTSLARTGRFEQAVGHFNFVLAAQPEHHKARKRLAACLYQLGRTDEAIQQFENLLIRTPADADAHRRLGLALAAQNKIDRAIDQLREARRLEPDNAQIRADLDRIMVLQK